MKRRNFFSSLAFASAVAAPAFFACNNNNSGATSAEDAAVEASTGDDDANQGDDSGALVTFDSAIAPEECTIFPQETDPVGFCLQKKALLGLHAQLTATGLPSDWDVYTLTPLKDDAGVVAHDVADDVAYGAALVSYAASAAVYHDTEISAVVSGDMTTVAHLVEQEVAQLPNDYDYDGAFYFNLRRFAAGLALAGMTTDGNAVDALAVAYGRRLYTYWFHPLGGSTGDAAVDGGDAGAPSSDDAGAPVDGILGTAAGSGFAYSSDKVAAGAAALVDMAVRAQSGTLVSVDAGVDATTLSDPSDALAWSQAAQAIFNHLVAHARDTSSGLYLTSLQTSGGAGQDTIEDDGSYDSETQGAVALALARVATLLKATPLSAMDASSVFASESGNIFDGLQGTPALWDTAPTDATLIACTNKQLTTCGGGYFSTLDNAKVLSDPDKSVRANARLFSALTRLTLVASSPEVDNLIPLTVLFMPTAPLITLDLDSSAGAVPATRDTFFTQVVNQSDFAETVARDFVLTEYPDGGGIDGGEVEPVDRAYSAGATAEALNGLNDQWLTVTGAPTLFQ